MNSDEATLVFGGSGFIGANLLELLRDRGAKNLVSIDLQEPRRRVLGVHYIKADVRDLKNINFDLSIGQIYNLAAVHTTPGHKPWEYYDTNVRGAIEVTRFARRHNVNRIIFTSSISVYGPTETSKDESAPLAPVSDYGRSKQMAEEVHRDWLAESEFHRLVITRPAVVFGLGESGNFTRLARILGRGLFLYPGRRDTVKSCIYVRDLLTWIMTAASRSERYILFNGAYSNRYTIEEIVESFKTVAYPRVRTFTIPSNLMKCGAALLRYAPTGGLGIHPDRIDKLMVSTNILPGWAEAEGLKTRDRLEAALADWRKVGGGAFL